MKHNVTMFTPYPVKVGQKIHINGSKRNGDWEIIEVGETKMTIKCPISHKEIKCDRFCYLVEETENKEWPVE